MYPVSADWDPAIRGARQKLARVEVRRTGQATVTLVAKDGTVRVDESSAVRRSLTLTLADLYLPDGSSLTPRTATDLLAPFGTEIWVWSGHRYASGQEELVPVGVFSPTVTNRPSELAPLQITAPDRSRAVTAAKFLIPYNVAVGTSIPLLITTLIQRGGAFPVLDLSGSRAVTTAATTYDAGVDPWEKARSLATTIGCEVAPNVTGQFVIRPVPQVATPVWTVDVDAARGALLDLGQSMTSEGVYNACSVSSSAVGGDPVTGYAWVADGPLSVSAIGWRPFFFTTPIGISSTAQAMHAAAGLLPSKMAPSRVFAPVTVSNPALDTGDTLRLSLPPLTAMGATSGATGDIWSDIWSDIWPGVVTWTPTPRFATETLDVVTAAFSLSLHPDAQGMTHAVRYPVTAMTGTVVTGS